MKGAQKEVKKKRKGVCACVRAGGREEGRGETWVAASTVRSWWDAPAALHYMQILILRLIFSVPGSVRSSILVCLSVCLVFFSLFFPFFFYSTPAPFSSSTANTTSLSIISYFLFLRLVHLLLWWY